MYLNSFNIVVIVAALLVAVSFASGMFHIEKLERLAWVPLTLAVLFMIIEILVSLPNVNATL